MKLELPGSKEDLIKKLEVCGDCPIEELLLPEQRQNKVLDMPIPKDHVTREIIEQICDKHFDEDPCPLKYALMRVPLGDFRGAQIGAIYIFRWDLGKRLRRKVDYNEAMMEWARPKDLGRGKIENYAERARYIWTLAGRKDGRGIPNHSSILTSKGLYEATVAGPEAYKAIVDSLELLKQEHLLRDAL